MLRASLLAGAKALPQARQGSYFFNRIGQKHSFNIGFFSGKPRRLPPNTSQAQDAIEPCL